MYVMLCGYPPFNGNSEASIYNKIKSGKYSFDPVSWAGISSEAKDLISKILVVDPEERYSA